FRNGTYWTTVPNRVDFQRLFVKQIASFYDDLGLAFELIRLCTFEHIRKRVALMVMRSTASRPELVQTYADLLTDATHEVVLRELRVFADSKLGGKFRSSDRSQYQPAGENDSQRRCSAIHNISFPAGSPQYSTACCSFVAPGCGW